MKERQTSGIFIYQGIGRACNIAGVRHIQPVGQSLNKNGFTASQITAKCQNAAGTKQTAYFSTQDPGLFG